MSTDARVEDIRRKSTMIRGKKTGTYVPESMQYLFDRIDRLEGLLNESTYALRGEVVWLVSIVDGAPTASNKHLLLKKINEVLGLSEAGFGLVVVE